MIKKKILVGLEEKQVEELNRVVESTKRTQNSIIREGIDMIIKQVKNGTITTTTN